jgi:RNA 3'-terminal phosphate cyclase-like protein
MEFKKNEEIKKESVLYYEGINFFRQKIICSFLSGKNIEISNIKKIDLHHISLLKLLEKITKGTKITITKMTSKTEKKNKNIEDEFLQPTENIKFKNINSNNNITTTKISISPGLIVGGSHLVHSCKGDRGLSYFIEPLLCIGIFGKYDIDIILKGFTNHYKDLSVDCLRNTTINLFPLFGLENKPTIQILKRGATPKGLVFFFN